MAELGKELGGCDFTGEDQKSFLTCCTNCDVQATPGNGKTTLLVAKLALLSRTWVLKSRGVCVISHTNAAREVVETKLATHPTAFAFLGYPHFIGTVTAFIDRFLALPYLRGLGWKVKRIDDDIFEAVARSRYTDKGTLSNSARINKGRNKHSIESWVSKMELAPDFECTADISPTRLKIRNRGNRQPGLHTKSGIELEELKAELVNDGLYRFGDMTALANRALDACPGLIECIRNRFPLVMLDEAQDTNGAHLELLDRLFSQGISYQRLGDQNQTLYEDPDLPSEAYWGANKNIIPLNETRRFGPDIAAFTSRLTVRHNQQIQGKHGEPSRRTLLLFDRPSIGRVLPTYVEEVRNHWGQTLTADHQIWAVASRHNIHRDPKGDWPKSLIDYHPTYRSCTGSRSRLDCFCGVMRKASLLYRTNKPTSEVVDLVTAGLIECLKVQGHISLCGQKVTSRNLWRVLASVDACKAKKVRRLVLDHVLDGNAPWEVAEWETFCNELKNALGITAISQECQCTANDFLQFHDEGAVAVQVDVLNNSLTKTEFDGITVRLGSIHSMKGRTVDAILVLESEIYRGPAKEQRAMDLSEVLPHAFGIATRDLAKTQALLSAATNIFVAATRPRQVLSLALRKGSAPQLLLEAADKQGWHIRDLSVENV